MSYSASSSRTGGSFQSVSWRAPSGACSPRRYLPDSRPPRERAPDQDPDALVEAGGDDLVLGLAGLQRVVDLLADEALEAVPLGDAERLHELPARVVRAADVADLARADEVVERLERLLERRDAVPLVHLVEVDVVRRAAGAGSPRRRR